MSRKNKDVNPYDLTQVGKLMSNSTQKRKRKMQSRDPYSTVSFVHRRRGR